MANNLYEVNGAGAFRGTVLIQSSTEIGGSRSVFVDLKGRRNDLVYPTFGGLLKNPFKVPAKFFAGDLFEIRYNDKGEKPDLFLLKTYEVKSMSETTVKIYRDGFRHVPYVGEVLMKAPSKIGGTGKAYTITKVVAEMDSSDAVWTLTFGTAIDNCTDHDVLVEAVSESASGKMLLQNINAVADADGDMPYAVPSGVYNSEEPRYMYTPALGGVMYIHKMSKMPKCVLDLNESKINGWFSINAI